jgi:hypothetical protein
MRIVIINDVFGKKESIIPYGLNLAKHLKTDVDILHIIDPTVHQGVYSVVAGSKSKDQDELSGPKEAIMSEREKGETAIHEVLVKETLKHNYPLKIKSVIKVEQVEEAITGYYREFPDAIMVFNTEPDRYIFESRIEIINVIEKMDSVTLLVPPGEIYHQFNKVLMPADFSSDDESENYVKIQNLLNGLDSVINAVDVAIEKNYLQMELNGKAWLNMIHSIYPGLHFATNILNGSDYFDTIIGYINRNRPDLFLMPPRKRKVFHKAFNIVSTLKLLENIKVPVLYS